jgi:hypothetical protein
LIGDTNLDGKVDVTDLGNVASSYGTASATSWITGDFNYDGVVDVTDLGDLASNYGASLTDSAAASRMSATVTTQLAAIPEPSSLATVTTAIAASLRSRRRRRRITSRTFRPSLQRSRSS